MKTDKELMKKIIKKGVAVFAGCTIIATAFTGCTQAEKKKDTLLEGTILYQAQVMTVNEEPIIVTPEDDISQPNGYRIVESNHHYKDVVTGTIYHINPFTAEEALLMAQQERLARAKSEQDKQAVLNNPVINIRNYYLCGDLDVITLFEDEAPLTPLTNKLTADELNKAMEGNFTDADAIAVQQRIAEESSTKTLG